MSAVAACLSAAPASAFTVLQVSGSPKAMSIGAQHSSLNDVLSTLRQKFDLQFHSSISLDKQLTGTYRGSLFQVVSRLLEGYNFVLRSNQDRLEVTVLGTQSKSEPSNTAHVSTSLAATPAAGANSGPTHNTTPLTSSGPMQKTTPSPAPAPGMLSPRDQSANSPVCHVQNLGAINNTTSPFRAA